VFRLEGYLVHFLVTQKALAFQDQNIWLQYPGALRVGGHFLPTKRNTYLFTAKAMLQSNQP